MNINQKTTQSLTVQQTNSADVDLICYCFHYTATDIERDVAENQRSTIMEKIISEKRSGGCQCATKNPKGR